MNSAEFKKKKADVHHKLSPFLCTPSCSSSNKSSHGQILLLWETSLVWFISTFRIKYRMCNMSQSSVALPRKNQYRLWFKCIWSLLQGHLQLCTASSAGCASGARCRSDHSHLCICIQTFMLITSGTDSNLQWKARRIQTQRWRSVRWAQEQCAVISSPRGRTFSAGTQHVILQGCYTENAGGFLVTPLL